MIARTVDLSLHECHISAHYSLQTTSLASTSQHSQLARDTKHQITLMQPTTSVVLDQWWWIFLAQSANWQHCYCTCPELLVCARGRCTFNPLHLSRALGMHGGHSPFQFGSAPKNAFWLGACGSAMAVCWPGGLKSALPGMRAIGSPPLVQSVRTKGVSLMMRFTAKVIRNQSWGITKSCSCWVMDSGRPLKGEFTWEDREII